jgi:hypothetical protein
LFATVGGFALSIFFFSNALVSVALKSIYNYVKEKNTGVSGFNFLGWFLQTKRLKKEWLIDYSYNIL